MPMESALAAPATQSIATSATTIRPPRITFFIDLPRNLVSSGWGIWQLRGHGLVVDNKVLRAGLAGACAMVFPFASGLYPRFSYAATPRFDGDWSIFCQFLGKQSLVLP